MTQIAQEKKDVKVSPLAEKYLSLVNGGGGGTVFTEFTQQSGQPGPHPGPFWEQIVRLEVSMD